MSHSYGRVVNHDPRSRQFAVPVAGVVASASWPRQIAVLDQGQVGSCTGNATVGVLGTHPYYSTLAAALAGGLSLDEQLAQRIYSDAETIDGDGPYPPNDNGSSGLSVAQAAKALGLIAGYTHILSLDAAHTAILSGPFIVGTDWFDGMETPASSGLVEASGQVLGGHEYECYGYDATADLWWFWNSWGRAWGKGGAFCYTSATFTRLLAREGDATVFVPLTSPPPTPAPTPVPAGTSYTLPGPVQARVDRAATRANLTDQAWLTRHLTGYFNL